VEHWWEERAGSRLGGTNEHPSSPSCPCSPIPPPSSSVPSPSPPPSSPSPSSQEAFVAFLNALLQAGRTSLAAQLLHTSSSSSAATSSSLGPSSDLPAIPAASLELLVTQAASKARTREGKGLSLFLFPVSVFPSTHRNLLPCACSLNRKERVLANVALPPTLHEHTLFSNTPVRSFPTVFTQVLAGATSLGDPAISQARGILELAARESQVWGWEGGGRGEGAGLVHEERHLLTPMHTSSSSHTHPLSLSLSLTHTHTHSPQAARRELQLLEVIPWLQTMELELTPQEVLQEPDRVQLMRKVRSSRGDKGGKGKGKGEADQGDEYTGQN
jgi:hypothetical protein